MSNIKQIQVTSSKKLPFGYFITVDGSDKGRWQTPQGAIYTEDNKVKIGNGNYVRLESNGDVVPLMKDGKFTKEGNILLNAGDKQNMIAGHVYDVILDDDGVTRSFAAMQSGNFSINPGWRNDVQDLKHITEKQAYGDDNWKKYNPEKEQEIQAILKESPIKQNSFLSNLTFNAQQGGNDGITQGAIDKFEKSLVAMMATMIVAPAAAEVAMTVPWTTVPGMLARQGVEGAIFGVIAEPVADKLTSNIKNPTTRNILKGTTSFALTAVGSKGVGKGVQAGTRVLRNTLDRPFRPALKLANKIDNASLYYTKYIYPDINRLRLGATTLENGIIGAADGYISDKYKEHPIISLALSAISPTILYNFKNTIRKALYRSSGGQDSFHKVKKILTKKRTAYSGYNAVSERSSRQLNGRKSYTQAYDVNKKDVANFQYTPTQSNMFGFNTIGEYQNGMTYKSKLWKSVNPGRKLAYDFVRSAYGNYNRPQLNRRPKGSIISVLSSVDKKELNEILNKAHNDVGKTLSFVLSSKKGIPMDLQSYGDVIIGRNKDNRLIAYNQRGNVQSSMIFKLPNDKDIHVGVDFGGTGSAGAADLTSNNRFAQWAIKDVKNFLDKDAVRLPVVASILDVKLTRGGLGAKTRSSIGFTKNNVKSYILKDYDIKRGEKKRIHF